MGFAIRLTNQAGHKQYNLVKRKVDKELKVAPQIKEELDKQLPKFDELVESVTKSNYVPPDRVLKEMDANFESFFFKRAYSERNFGFYIQICAQQYKPEEAMKAFKRMVALKIKPTDTTYT